MYGKILLRKTNKLLGIILLLVLWTGLFYQNVAYAQNQSTVKGTIVDAHTKKPVTAAQISDLNNTASAVSDENGNLLFS